MHEMVAHIILDYSLEERALNDDNGRNNAAHTDYFE